MCVIIRLERYSLLEEETSETLVSISSIYCLSVSESVY